jgi:ABC-type uncharacterized transport system fused permease/ATPase subunit
MTSIMSASDDEPRGATDARSLRRFWRAARGFWRTSPTVAWGLIGLLTIGVVAQLVVQYRLNLWNRDFFNALERRDRAEIWDQVFLLPALAAASVALGIFAGWGRMSFQRGWRAWLTADLIDTWLPSLLRHPPAFVNGDRQNAEYRIAEDARLATDAPIDLLIGLLSALLGGATFIVVLWNVGGALAIPIGGGTVSIQGYLVYAVLLYSLMTSGAMVWIARHMVDVIERKNQSEADLRFELARMREQPTDVPMVEPVLADVIRHWRLLRDQHMRTTLVSHANTLLAPVLGLLLCVPNYVRGELLLGEVTQAAAAFVVVQSAGNWLVDNYPRLAECLSSAVRVGDLLMAIDAQSGSAPTPPAAGDTGTDPRPS